jgi:glycosyltransferase involved in cell wall biosynthesis
VVIPALDPDHSLVELVADLKQSGLDRTVIIDDGSSESCQQFFEECSDLGATVKRHPTNLGKGCALRLGFQTARSRFPDSDTYVTADSDGQHTAADISAIAEASREHPDAIVLGTRDFSQDNVPARSRFGNRMTSLLFRAKTGVNCPDTQTGLRGLPARIASWLDAIPGDRYEYEMNMLLMAAEEKMDLFFVPIATIYENNNEGSHFRTIQDSYLVYKGLVGQIVKFAGSSLTCAAFDLGGFWLLDHFVFGGATFTIAGLPVGTAYASIITRVAAGCLNFLLNKHTVFGDRRKLRGPALRYLATFCGVMLCSAAGTQILTTLTPVPAVLCKAFTDLVLFFVNYTVQKRWVFSSGRH